MLVQGSITDAERLKPEFLAPFPDLFGQTIHPVFARLDRFFCLAVGIWTLAIPVQRYNFPMTDMSDKSQPTAANQRLYTASQVRELDRCAIEDHGIAGLELMERAGQSVFEAIRNQYPDRQRWLVVCGGGNNGGDGYVVARLALEQGISCKLYALKPPDALRGDAALAAQRWIHAGGQAEPESPACLERIDLVVDALLGTGLDRPPEGDYAEVIKRINLSDAVTVAVDVPSGLNSDTGRIMGLAVKAEMTVTFIGRKRGLYTADGPDCSGLLKFDRLGVPDSVYQRNFTSGELIHEFLISRYLKKRHKNSHKGHFGWILGIGGDAGMSGALRLCGEATLRSGGGKVTLVTHPEHASTLNIGCPELMVRDAEAGSVVRALLKQADVVVLGTGLGQSSWSVEMLNACRDHVGPMVVDADALNLIAKESALERISEHGSQVIMTPHPAEAGRLLGVDSRVVQNDRISAAKELARQGGCVAVLKGCGTVISDPAGRYAICPLGNPGMASGGTGDVLAGVIGAMLAQGLDAWAAARVGVTAHAAAADVAAAEIGERGMIASDITRFLPSVLNPGQKTRSDS